MDRWREENEDRATRQKDAAKDATMSCRAWQLTSEGSGIRMPGSKDELHTQSYEYEQATYPLSPQFFHL